jgi:endo-beta-N-acetylglucosaminidase D
MLYYLKKEESISNFIFMKDQIFSLPFLTNFNTGIGKNYFINGKVFIFFI